MEVLTALKVTIGDLNLDRGQIKVAIALQQLLGAKHWLKNVSLWLAIPLVYTIASRTAAYGWTRTDSSMFNLQAISDDTVPAVMAANRPSVSPVARPFDYMRGIFCAAEMYRSEP